MRRRIKLMLSMAAAVAAAVAMHQSVLGQNVKASGSSSEEQSPPSGPFLTTLFAMGPNMGFVGFDEAEKTNGAKVAVTTELSLSNKTVSRPRGAALDKHGRLYLVSGANGGSIAVYDKPLNANGHRRPDRIVAGKATRISRSPTGIAIDRQNDLLYVSNAVTDLLVFDISSPEKFQGPIAPLRTFDVDMSLFRAKQICFANGSLYVVTARGGTSDILAFDKPDKLRGKVTPDRVISYQEFDNRVGVDVDSKDRLLVGVRKLGKVLIYRKASTLDGPAKPDVMLSIAGTDVAPMPSFATTDSEDRLYIADANGGVLFSFDNSAQLTSGEHFPDRTIDSRDLIAPSRLLVFAHR